MENTIQILETLIRILGDVTLGEAKKWAEVKENWESLRSEGHSDVELTGPVGEDQ